MQVFHQHEHTACPGLPFQVQTQVQQGMHGTGGTGKDKEITREFQVLWNHPAQRPPKDHKSRMPLTTFCLVQQEHVS